uniref:Uncharacterized protein TCIL3000_11_3880 n=1 Tax=Trypanosoma congolense (strain IL3000) TaxID=1068625 RepID=G0V019_TRYCI|nr:unnamed protein product [Trypanosoma congolense IL3000]
MSFALPSNRRKSSGISLSNVRLAVQNLEDSQRSSRLMSCSVDTYHLVKRRKSASDHLKRLSSKGNTTEEDNRVPTVERRSLPMETVDPLMKQLELRYTALPSERQFGSNPAGHRNRGGLRRDVVDTSMQAVQEEAVALLTRHLPCIPSNAPNMEEMNAVNRMPMDAIADDRITPRTIHKLLCKGYARDKQRQYQRVRSKQVLEDLDELTPKQVTAALSVNVGRMEPPYLDKMIDAKVCSKPHKDGVSSTRTVCSITSDGTPFAQAPANHYHSHLVAPPPSRSSIVEAQPMDMEPPQRLGSGRATGVAGAKRIASSSMSLPVTLSTAVGDDTNIVEQVVAYAAARRRPSLAVVANSNSDLNSKELFGAEGDLLLKPAYKPLLSTLDAVLSVSKEYEKAQLQWPGRSASCVGATRRAIMDRITSFRSSCIPPELWVTVHEPTLPGTRFLQHPQLVEKGPVSDVSEKTLVFPAVNPVGRAQVYLLADALDRMLRERSDDLRVLADKEMAHLLIPEELKSPNLKAKGVLSSAQDVDPHGFTLSEEAHRQYIRSAERVMEVIDTGLIEIARQVGSFCIERGALLDCLRIAVKDLTSSCMSLVSYCKERAREEAKARHELLLSSCEQMETIVGLREELRNVKGELHELQETNDDNVKKARKYDTLIERLMMKDSAFYKRAPEEHLSLLMELEESSASLLTRGMNVLYYHNEANPREAQVSESPTVRMATLKKKERREALRNLYEESHRLIGALSKAMQSVEVACLPLYDYVELPKHKSTVNIASSKWAQIASAIGSYEIEKKHRQRVFEVFSRWNASHGISGDGARDTCVGGEDSDEREIIISSRHQSTFRVPSICGDGNDDNKSKDEQDDVVDDTPSKGGVDEPCLNPKKRLQLITKDDLIEMGVRDCTPEEINALYAAEFDLASYLRPEWEPPGDVELSPVVLRDMLHDVTESLSHITIRMEALSKSGFIHNSLKPSAVPPTLPEVPCSLCGRRDRVAMARKGKADALQKVANEIQRRYEVMLQRCKRSESECEKLRRELQIQQGREYRLSREYALREEEFKKINADLAESMRKGGRHSRQRTANTERRPTSLMPSSVLSEILSSPGSPMSSEHLGDVRGDER